MSRRNGRHQKDPYETERRRLQDLEDRRKEKEPYDPSKMEVKAPLGCVLIGLAIAGLIFWTVVYKLFRMMF